MLLSIASLHPPARLNRIAAGAIALLLVAAPATSAQRADSARAGAAAPANPRQPADSLLRPPISPRRAFISSFLFPGSGQAVLRRPVSGTVYAGAELLSLFMIAKSREDLRLAKAAPDSIVVDFVRDDEGEIIIDPETGEPTPILEEHPLPPRLRARRHLLLLPPGS